MLLGARYACSRNMCWYSMYTCTRAFGHLLRENYLWECKFKELTLHENLTISYSVSASSITPVEPLKPSLYDYFVISVYFVYFIFIWTTMNLHMTNSKVRNSDSAYSIYFTQVLLELFTFLIQTANKEIYNIFDTLLFPYYFNTDRTNKQTNKHKSSFNNKD